MMSLMRRSAVGAVFLAGILILVPLQHSQAQEISEGSRRVLNRVAPQYPGAARPLNIQGSVKIEVVVAPNGTVKSLEIKGGHPLLVQAAQDAIRQWKWEPSPRETTESIEIKFKPQQSSPPAK
jgi:TonB family protein